MVVVADSQTSIRCGIELSVLRRWTKSPKKGQIGIKLVVGGALTKEQYFELKDNASEMYNNKLLVELLIQTNYTATELSAVLKMTPSTLRSFAQGNGSKKTNTIIKLFCEKMGIDYVSYTNKGNI